MMKSCISRLTLIACTSCVALVQPAVTKADEIDFQRDIAPILEQRCWHCHGEDEQESGLRLDLRAQHAARWRLWASQPSSRASPTRAT